MSKTAHDYASKDRTSDVLSVENVNIDFASLLLSGDVLKGLSRAGFERPSPIQLKAIPIGRCGLGNESYLVKNFQLEKFPYGATTFSFDMK